MLAEVAPTHGGAVGVATRAVHRRVVQLPPDDDDGQATGEHGRADAGPDQDHRLASDAEEGLDGAPLVTACALAFGSLLAVGGRPADPLGREPLPGVSK